MLRQFAIGNPVDSDSSHLYFLASGRNAQQFTGVGSKPSNPSNHLVPFGKLLVNLVTKVRKGGQGQGEGLPGSFQARC